MRVSTFSPVLVLTIIVGNTLDILGSPSGLGSKSSISIISASEFNASIYGTNSNIFITLIL